jgi:hypothetical protein
MSEKNNIQEYETINLRPGRTQVVTGYRIYILMGAQKLEELSITNGRLWVLPVDVGQTVAKVLVQTAVDYDTTVLEDMVVI